MYVLRLFLLTASACSTGSPVVQGHNWLWSPPLISASLALHVLAWVVIKEGCQPPFFVLQCYL